METYIAICTEHSIKFLNEILSICKYRYMYNVYVKLNLQNIWNEYFMVEL